MQFYYRYVRFGTKFVEADGARPGPNGGTAALVSDDASRLYANELAVDVGGVCWGFDGERRAILDHHFHRDKQYPSAAAAVLHNAERIADRFRDCREPIWLVAHQQPDFDAWCAMYLARGILQKLHPGSDWSIPHTDWDKLGLSPDGWGQTFREIDWFRPNVTGWEPARRSAVLLASVAAFVDNCRAMSCPMNATLDSVLYAAVARGRDYAPQGALEFFDAVRQRLERSQPLLNPLFDSVLAGHATFAPELEMLDRELAIYQSDLRRARKTVVYVQQGDRPFHDWFPEAAAAPLLNDDLSINPAQLRPAGMRCAQVDGVFLRDPKCLLFKSWVRRDTDNSSMGRGFTFTAIAYSGGRNAAVCNTTDYFFSLDPERAQSEGWHLYNVWARLEAEELRRFVQNGDSRVSELRDVLRAPSESHADPDSRCRTGFERRAGVHKPLMGDPWFDGNNYAGTIIATPNMGSLIGAPGMNDDLADDLVASLVSSELQSAALPHAVHLMRSDHSHRGYDAEKFGSLAEALAGMRDIPAQAYLFCRTELAAGIDPTHGQTAESIGRILWELLDEDQADDVPANFVERHLLHDRSAVRIWSRRGIVIAHSAAGAEGARRIQKRFKDLIDLLTTAESLVIARAPEGERLMNETKLGEQLHREEHLLADLAEYARYLATPEGELLRRFFDASGLAEYLKSVHDLHASHASRMITRRLDANLGYMAHVQNAIEWVEILIVSIYAVELSHTLGETFSFAMWYVGFGALGLAGLTAYEIAQVLRPWEHASGHAADHEPPPPVAHNRPKVTQRERLINAFKVMVGGLLVYLIVGWMFFYRPNEHGGHGASSSGSAPSSGAPSAQDNKDH